MPLKDRFGRLPFRRRSRETFEDKRNRIALVTANFGGIDAIRSFPPCEGVDAFYYTDRDTASGSDADAMASWTRVVVPDYPRHDFNPRLRGRYFKHQIHRLPEVSGYRWLAWADANVQFHDASFLTAGARRLGRLPERARAMLIEHPHRDTVRMEFDHIVKEIAEGSEYLRLRYADERMPEQMAFFAAQGWNLDAKLWCGTVWLIENSGPVTACWDAWWDQNLRYGMMDQLSLPMMLARFGIRPENSGLSLVDNRYFTWGAHRKLC